jgi:MFS family permease
VASALKELVRQPRLFVFLLVSSLCCLLDEVIVALAALRFRLDQGQSLSVITIGSTLFALGGIAGAVLTDRVLTRVSVRAVLWSSSSLCLLSLVLLTLTDSALASLALLTALGVTAAPHHALIQAAAYEELPGKPGLVNAALQLFVVIEIAAPLAVGVAAAEVGLNAALFALALQPLAVAWVAARTGPRAPL